MSLLTIKHPIPFIESMMRLTTAMWQLGWDERNGGNISLLLEEREVAPFIETSSVLKTIKLPFSVKKLAGWYGVTTATGSYFRQIAEIPEQLLGVFHVQNDGTHVDILWGFKEENAPTSELSAHFLSHARRLEVDPQHRAVLHCHSTYTLAMTHVHPLKEEDFSKTLWKMCTECLYVFPEGVGIVPWFVPGTVEAGDRTAERMKEVRAVLWPQHGIFGTGRSLNEAFGLVETIEKAAKIYMILSSHSKKELTHITEEQLKAFAKAFGVTPRAGIL